MNLTFNHLLFFIFFSGLLFALESRPPFISMKNKGLESTEYLSTSNIMKEGTLFHKSSEIFADTIVCEGETIILDGLLVNTPGRHRYTFTSVNGLDSLGELNVIILRPTRTSEDQEICSGEDFKGYTETGTYTDTTFSRTGCDSIIAIYYLNVLSPLDTIRRPIVNLCPGESFINSTPRGEIKYENSSIDLKKEEEEFIYTSIRGCDSVVISTIFYYQDRVSTVEATICEGGDPFYADDGRELTTEGEHRVVLQSVHGCDSTIIVDLEVGNRTERDTLIPLCEGQSIFLDGKERFNGQVELTYTTLEGCDSIVNYIITVSDSIVIDTSATICFGDTFHFGGIAFTETTNTQFDLPSNISNCDSVMRLNLFVLDCEIKATIVEDSLNCSDDKNGRFSFTLTNGLWPFTYQWQYLDSLIEGRIDTLFETISAEGLPAGTYTITVTDQIRNVQEFNVQVKSPDFWSHTSEESDHNGFHISCAGMDDGAIEIFPEGGNAPYTYQWSNGEITQKIINLSADSFVVTVTDDSNCDYQVLFAVTEPSPLYVEIDSIKPNCDSLATGVINVVLEEGGVEPYSYAIPGIGMGVRGQFSGLLPGTYDLIVTDDNGCMAAFETDLPGPDIPELEIERNYFSELGDPIKFGIQANVDLEFIEWSTQEGLSCYDCIDPTATPVESTSYTITATSFDGCSTTETLSLNIDKKRDVYVPNIFSPNGDGLNDRLSVFGGPEVANVMAMRIYSRWGELVYEQSNINVNDELMGWNGTFQGRQVPRGTYIWFIQVSFIDGEVFEYRGTVALK